MRRWRIGREAGLRRLTRDDLVRFYRNFYRPSSTILSIVGDLDEGAGTTVVKTLDWINRLPMFILSNVLPDFRGFDNVKYVSDGFNIPAGVLLTQLTTTAAFLLPAFVFGFLCLKLREVAK